MTGELTITSKSESLALLTISLPAFAQHSQLNGRFHVVLTGHGSRQCRTYWGMAQGYSRHLHSSCCRLNTVWHHGRMGAGWCRCGFR